MKNKNWILSVLDDGGCLSISSVEGKLFNNLDECVRTMPFAKANHLIHSGVVIMGNDGVYVRGNDIEIPYSTHVETKVDIDNADRGYGTRRRMGD
ncbi:hypothetical protein VP199E371_P0068 [Vibrio phage 199E37-1]|nr:hypothetical protein VP199E371_P0068 [Vibrio phage 199E37-1]